MALSFLAGVDVETRPYQQRIISRALELFIDRGLRSLLIESPTGSGKTVMGLLTARAMQQALGVKVGWVAMRRNLLAQAEAENTARGIGVEASFLSMFDRDPPTGLDLLVVDEAQHDGAASMAHLHSKIRPRYILGLSATPFRADKVKLCFDSVLRDAGIQQLIQDGYLSNYHHYTIPTYSPAEVARTFLADRPRWGQSIMYFHSIRECRQVEALLRAAGVVCEVVTGDSDRETQLGAFRDGRAEVLINCLVLAEGFDCPGLKTVFCRPSCKGVTIQMCGRVLRKHPDFPVKQIVQCQKTRWPFLRTATAAQQFVWGDGGWRSLTLNPHLQTVSGRMMQALARTEVVLPPVLKAFSERRRRRERHEVEA